MKYTPTTYSLFHLNKMDQNIKGKEMRRELINVGGQMFESTHMEQLLELHSAVRGRLLGNSAVW